MSDLFYRRPRLLVLALALILVSGFAALEVLPRSEDPELISRNALVTTLYVGADAGRVETQVTDKIEEELEEIEEVQLIDSVSRAGVSIVNVELRDTILETDVVWAKVRDRLDDAAARFPDGAGAPEFEESTITAWSLHVALRWDEGEPNLAVLGRLAADLEDLLRAVPGTEEADVYGAPREEIRVDVDPSRLATLGLSAESLARSLARGDAKVPSGRLDSGENELLLEVAGELDDLERIGHVPVATGSDGTLVRLGEIATIERAVADPPDQLAIVDERPGVLVAARMRSGERIDRWSERVDRALEGYLPRVPAGVTLETTFDQSLYTEERLEELFANLLLGAGLVVGVIFLMMGWRSALLVGSALPLSALMVLSGMRALGIPMHQMSVTGLIIALGLLIDNAIVMVDEVDHHLTKGEPIAKAVARSVKHLAVPLAASTTTTVLAFMPLVLAPGPVGEFVGAMSVAVVLAVTSSFFLSLTVIPALTGWMHRLGGGGKRTFLSSGFRSERLGAVYRKALGVLFRRPILAILVALTLPAIGFRGGTTLQEQFFPPAGRDQAGIDLVMPVLSSIDRTRAAAQRADAILRQHPSVESTQWVLGRSAPKFYYNQIELVRDAASYAGGLVQLTTNEDVYGIIRELQAALDDELPEAQVLVRQLEQGPPFEAPIGLILEGPELDVLFERGEALRALLAGVPDVIHTRAGLDNGRPKLLFQPDEEELELAGLDRVGVAGRLQAALSGRVAGSVFEDAEELPVRVRLDRSTRDETSEVAAIELAGAGSAEPSWVPLGALGRFELVPEAGRIPRTNGRRTNEIQAFVTAGTLPQDALETAAALLEDFDLPAGYTLRFGGEAAERDDAVGNLAASVGVLVVLMSATLVLSFQSFRMALMIGGVAMLSIGLSLGALWQFGHPFGFMAIVGSMGLMGIAINDSIVVLAALRADERTHSGDVAAVVDVVSGATRHILATTITTIAGFTPLLMESEGLWPPLATAIAGGVVGATLLALTFIPGMYVILARRKSRKSRTIDGSAPAATPEPSVAPLSSPA